MPKSVVIAGGTSGMGRATALARIARGDHVTVIGSDPNKAVPGARRPSCSPGYPPDRASRHGQPKRETRRLPV